MDSLTPLSPTLFETLKAALGAEMRTTAYSKTTLVHISHTLEDLVLRQHLPALILTGFQESSHWRAETERYRTLAQSVQQVAVFVGKPLPPDSHAAWWSFELQPGDPLLEEWFLLILAPTFSVILCGQDSGAAHDVEALRLFDTFLSFEPTVVNIALDLLEDYIAARDAQRVQSLRDLRLRCNTDATDLHLVSNFVREVLGFEEHLQKALDTAREAEERMREDAYRLALEQERLKVMLDFFRYASHDFRTPISTINTSLYLLERSHTEEQRRRHMRTLGEQAERLGDLVNELFTLYMLEDDSAIQRVIVSPADLIHDAVVQVESQLAAGHVTLEIQIDRDLYSVSVDRVAIHRALLHLLNNAIRYSPPGSTVTFSLTSYGAEQVALAIRDRGTGILPDDLPRIFEYFFRGDRARAVETGGLGLGLPIARRVIERHGGTILVESTPGAGSTFTVLLPRANPEAPPE